MYASIVVLSALVAVAAGQYFIGGAPINPFTGGVMDTPEVAHAKRVHEAIYTSEAIRNSYLGRKRREAPVPEIKKIGQEAPSEAFERQQDTVEKVQPGKRAVTYSYTPGFGLNYGWNGMSTLGAGWVSPSWNTLASPMFLRKRRDTTEVQTNEQPLEYSKVGKRQIVTAYNSMMPTWSPYTSYLTPFNAYSSAPFLFRKRRDTSGSIEEGEQVSGSTGLLG